MLKSKVWAVRLSRSKRSPHYTNDPGNHTLGSVIEPRWTEICQ